MTRKIIQIAASSEGDECYPLLYALCNDGTLWAARYTYDNPNSMTRFHWTRVPLDEIEK